MTETRPRPAFAHASEAELARILDFYQVAWAYEPRTFPILYDHDGAVLESFSPDFYLPDLDLYVEITTLKQRLVRKKNRKLRRLRELYPDIRVKLLYARDFRALLLKYGRITLADALSGAEGQATPPRRHLRADAARPGSTPPAAKGGAEGASRDGERPSTGSGRSRARRRSRAEARARSRAGAGSPTIVTTGTEMTA